MCHGSIFLAIVTSSTNSKISNEFYIFPEPTVRSAVPGVSPGRGLLIPHGYLHPGKCEHSEVQSSSMIAGASLWLMGTEDIHRGPASY